MFFMAHDRTRFRDALTRCLAVAALLGIYGISLIGASALLLAVSTHQAVARGGYGHGGFHGGGFHAGGFRGHGFGFGWGPYPYYGYGGYWPYYGDAGVCYAVRQRVKTRWGWGIRRVSICE
jgi:hypothetical protein